MMRSKNLGELIEQLQEIKNRFGDLPVGGESDIGVQVTICDEGGHDAIAYRFIPRMVFIEAH